MSAPWSGPLAQDMAGHRADIIDEDRFVAECATEEVAAYLVRCANAYPALVEALGLLRDTAENGLAAATLPVSPSIHVEGLTGVLRQMVASIDAALADTEDTTNA